MCGIDGSESVGRWPLRCMSTNCVVLNAAIPVDGCWFVFCVCFLSIVNDLLFSGYFDI